ncbi:MAG: Sel1 repeat, partial [Verrucomicrobiota bacterium]
NNLGICYLQGMGVEKNEVEAEKWFSRAAAQGNRDAENTLLQIKAGRDARKILQETEAKESKPE